MMQANRSNVFALRLIAIALLVGCEDKPDAQIAHTIDAAVIVLSSADGQELAMVDITTTVRAVVEPDFQAPLTLVGVERVELYDAQPEALLAELDADFEFGFDRHFRTSEDVRQARVLNVATTNEELSAHCGKPLRMGLGVEAVSPKGVEVAVEWTTLTIPCLE